MNLQLFLSEEKQRIIDWFHEYEENIGDVITIASFKWKDHRIDWKGDFMYQVDGNHIFESIEIALDFIEDLIIARYSS